MKQHTQNMERHPLRERQLVSGCAGEENGYNTQLLYFTCSSLTRDDRYLFMISDRPGRAISAGTTSGADQSNPDCVGTAGGSGSPNVWVKDLQTGEERQLSDNRGGIMKSYVYFDGTPGKGLSKASVCLDAGSGTAYYIQDNVICKADLQGRITQLNRVPANRVTAFTHVSEDGRFLCVPMTDGRALEYDPETEGEGLDRRPVFNIDQRVQDENLSSYLCVYDTQTGDLLYEKRIPKCWISHVQFNPADPEIIMYNHEWSAFDCGIRRIWLYDHRRDEVIRVRTEGADTLGNPRGFRRSRNDWVCHEMWSDDGKIIIYHGGYENGPAMVGKYDLESRRYWEIALPDAYNCYGHFTMDHRMNLVCDGYFRYPDDVEIQRENSTDNGPDPHKKDSEYICTVLPDWDAGTLTWCPQCRHMSDWLGQDAHPHPIYSHAGDRIFFDSRSGRYVKIYDIPVINDDPQG